MAVRHEPLVGIFDERGAADNAIEQLHNAGFNDDQICYSGNVSANTGGGGFLEAIKRFFTGNQTTRSSGVAHELSNMGLSDDEADYYAQQHEAGRSIVAIEPGERYGDALTVLRSNGGYSYRSGSAYNQVGTPTPATAYDQTAAGATPDNPQQSDYASQPDYRQTASYDQQAAGSGQVAGTTPAPDYGTQAPGAVHDNLQQPDYSAPSGYNQSTGYNQQAAGYGEQPPNYEQATNAASYNQQQATGSVYNPQAAGYTEQPSNYEQAANTVSYNQQQAASSGYNAQVAGYGEQPPNYEGAANAASYNQQQAVNQQAAGPGYNPQAAGYTEQPKSYDQETVSPDPEEERRRREREERREAARKRDDIVTDADTNP